MATNRFYSMKSVTTSILHDQAITEGQKKAIKHIETYTSHIFTGHTLREASRFIQSYKPEADEVCKSRELDTMNLEDRKLYKNGVSRPIIAKIRLIEEKLGIRYSDNWRPIRSDSYKFVEVYGGCLNDTE